MRVNYFLKSSTLHVSHHEEVLAVGLVAVMSLDDVGMVKGSQGTGFAEKTLQGGGIVRQLGRQHLQSDIFFEQQMSTAVHRSHAARSDRFHDEVAAVEDEIPILPGQH